MHDNLRQPDSSLQPIPAESGALSKASEKLFESVLRKFQRCNMAERLFDLSAAFSESWVRETSFDSTGWSPENPAWGQCAVTACIVQDLFGGEIVSSTAVLPDGSTSLHFFNQLPYRQKMISPDFTRRQFPKGTVVPPGQPRTEGFSSTREYILSFESTAERYRNLRRRVIAELGDLLKVG